MTFRFVDRWQTSVGVAFRRLVPPAQPGVEEEMLALLESRDVTLEAELNRKLDNRSPKLASGRVGFVNLGRTYLAGVSGSAAPAYVSFLVNGIALDCRIGDQISMRYGVICALTSGDFRSYFQVFVPGGGSVTSSNTLSSDTVAGNSTVLIEDLYTVTIDGVHAVTAVGGMVSGSATLFNQYLVADLLGLT